MVAGDRAPEVTAGEEESLLLNVIFGSDTDEGKVLPGIVQASREMPEARIRVNYASVDNTPSKVNEILDLCEKRVLITGAGLANVLTGVAKTFGDIYTLNIGIPIYDDSSEGLTSLLSTAEKPPRNPVLAVGVNNSYAALNIAHRFLRGLRNVVLLDNKVLREGVAKLSPAEKRTNIWYVFEQFGLPYTLKSLDTVSPDDVVITPFLVDRRVLAEVDHHLMRGNGVQVGVNITLIRNYSSVYQEVMGGLQATGVVSSRGYLNAAIVAAQLTGNREYLGRIGREKEEKAEKLKAHRGLIVWGGEVTRL